MNVVVSKDIAIKIVKRSPTFNSLEMSQIEKNILFGYYQRLGNTNEKLADPNFLDEYFYHINPPFGIFKTISKKNSITTLRRQTDDHFIPLKEDNILTEQCSEANLNQEFQKMNESETSDFIKVNRNIVLTILYALDEHQHVKINGTRPNVELTDVLK